MSTSPTSALIFRLDVDHIGQWVAFAYISLQECLALVLVESLCRPQRCSAEHEGSLLGQRVTAVPIPGEVIDLVWCSGVFLLELGDELWKPYPDRALS